MADFISFNEGRKQVGNNGLPSTCYFLLSTKDCNTHVVGDTLAGGVGEITGTGYARQTSAEPTGSTANPSVFTFSTLTWSTGTATDWPSSVKSVVMATTVDNSGQAICAWNLQTGGGARAFNAANTTENFSPVLNIA